MKGRYVRRRWGWDCHGLPIENIVEQSLKISGKKQIEEIGVDKFNQACRESVFSASKTGIKLSNVSPAGWILIIPTRPWTRLTRNRSGGL